MPSVTPTAAARGYDTLLEVEASAGVWTALEEVVRLTPVPIRRDRIDVTRLRPMSDAPEFIPGPRQEAELTFDMNWVPGSAADTLLRSLAAAGQTALKSWRITFPTGKIWTFSGFVSAMTPGDVSFTAAMSASVVITTSGDITVSDLAAPANLLLPAIAGIAQVGQPLTVIENIWSGGPAFGYQWQANGGSWANISGATARIYTPVVGQLAQPIRCIVTGTNSAGSASATSGATAAVIAA